MRNNIVKTVVILLILCMCQFAAAQEQKDIANVKSPSPAWSLPAGVKTLPVNGYPMAYFERGSGSTVVLVHGALNDYRYWMPQISSLSPRYRIIAVSLRHYYPERWDGKGDDFSLKMHAEDVAAFIERLGAGPVYLVAHSRGGSVALAVIIAVMAFGEVLGFWGILLAIPITAAGKLFITHLRRGDFAPRG